MLHENNIAITILRALGRLWFIMLQTIAVVMILTSDAEIFEFNIPYRLKLSFAATFCVAGWYFILSESFSTKNPMMWLDPMTSYKVSLNRDLILEANIAGKTFLELIEPEAEWCRMSCKGRWRVSPAEFCFVFSRREDAALFSLFQGMSNAD